MLRAGLAALLNVWVYWFTWVQSLAYGAISSAIGWARWVALLPQSCVGLALWALEMCCEALAYLAGEPTPQQQVRKPSRMGARLVGWQAGRLHGRESMRGRCISMQCMAPLSLRA